MAHLGGAMSRVPLEATAYPLRRPHFIMNVHTRWRDKAQDDGAIKWARALFEEAAPFAAGSAYVNFMPADEAGRVAEAYGANYRRLAQVKERYDPNNLFRLNQNIRPA
jgi:FAD/FMN-containing dehydrogenase